MRAVPPQGLEQQRAGQLGSCKRATKCQTSDGAGTRVFGLGSCRAGRCKGASSKGGGIGIHSAP